MRKFTVILYRMIAFPAVAFIGLISSIRLWLSFCLNYITNGGELVAFKKRTRNTIATLLEIVEDRIEDDERLLQSWKELIATLDKEKEISDEKTNQTAAPE